jgi:malate dehydrogenase
MSTAAIIGAGELGGAVAQALAVRDLVARILIVDAAGGVAAGKALDIQQMGAVQGFHTRLDGTDDPTRVAGSDVCVVADRFGRTSTEWQGEDASGMIARLPAGDAPLVFAGAMQAELLARAVREGGVRRARAIGSAPEAFRSAVTGIVALEARCSPADILLTVLGTPRRFVIPWSEASIGGYALERVLSPPQIARLEARAARLWPVGAYALGAAAARVAGAALAGSRRTVSVLTMLTGEFAVKDRPGTLPALLGPRGIVHTRVPALNSRERVLLDTALGQGW